MAATTEGKEGTQEIPHLSTKESAKMTVAAVMQGEDEEEWPTPVVASASRTQTTEQADAPKPRRKSKVCLMFVWHGSSHPHKRTHLDSPFFAQF